MRMNKFGTVRSLLKTAYVMKMANTPTRLADAQTRSRTMTVVSWSGRIVSLGLGQSSSPWSVDDDSRREDMDGPEVAKEVREDVEDETVDGTDDESSVNAADDIVEAETNDARSVIV